jgi:hypothetical protein
MLLLKALKLEINTTAGLYGTTIPFLPGLNIIRANNTSGKSTLFQAILYALGFEELIGGRNEKTMQSVLKDIVVENGRNHQVIQSSVFLELYNGVREITIRRDVINEKRKSQLVDVIYGPAISKPDGSYELRQMYVHDKGAATDDLYGFHSFLEEYLGWDIPDVVDTTGNSTKLYLPLIAPAFILEQKSGWSSFFATMPYYGIKNAEERVIEFLLNLDVFQNEQKRISINIDKKVVQDRWKDLFEQFKRLGLKASAEIVGIEDDPRIINNFSEVYFRVFRNHKYYLVPELIHELQEEYEQILKQTDITVGENVGINQQRLQQFNDNLLRLNLRHEQLEDEIIYEREKLKQYILQKKNVEEDLRKNKSAEKMIKLGGEVGSAIALNHCPTCGQTTKDSLLPAEVDQIPMKIEENINFLTSKLKMIEIVVASQRKKLIDKETVNTDYRNRVSHLRQQIRSLKRDLVSDDRLPSEELIERKINLKKLIGFYIDILENIEDLKIKLKTLSNEWEEIKKYEASLLGDFFTPLDREKIQFLEEAFLELLRKFNYQSKDKDTIRISREKYLPVIEVKLPNEKSKTYDIRFDSSGSDHIRCMWAYYIALLKTSNKYGGTHPKLLIFDEPQQQSASTTDFHEFLNELSSLSDSQAIVFASFQNSLADFKAATKSLVFHKIESDSKFVQKFDPKQAH